MKVLITGIAGTLARLVAERLVAQGHRVLGIDRRPWPDAPRGVEMFTADIRKRPAEDVFRTRKPDALIHMATVTHVTTPLEARYRINLEGTRALFDHCNNYGVKAAIFVGRHTVYGAASDAALYRTEDDPPLAGATFPDLSDLVAADLYAASALWRHPEVSTAVLRIVYTLGVSYRGPLGNYLKPRNVPMVMGFDPLFQLMHEHDAANAIVAAVEHKLRGVFNVVGPPPVPLSLLIKGTGRRPIPIPGPLFPFATGRFGFAHMPKGSINHLKHPVVVDGSRFKAETGFEHEFDEVQIMEAFRLLGSV